jgi:hypothetical protein
MSLARMEKAGVIRRKRWIKVVLMSCWGCILNSMTLGWEAACC